MTTYLAIAPGMTTGAGSLEELADRLRGTVPELRPSQLARPGAHTRPEDVAGFAGKRVEVRAVDKDHPEYGEGIVGVRTRGQVEDRSDPQTWLGGRPLNETEAARWAELQGEGR